ncbi:MAG: deoxyhypusine synthase, partial [Deltaproteobacteria bacterium]|nr:deoxyhypusine synthase [Deltaproteobacteria bacterium]
QVDVRPLVDGMAKTAFQARNLGRAAEIYARMLRDKDCTIILTLAGSIFGAGLKKIVYDMVKHDMVDAIVSTGAIMVDQDFFEGLGFSHYQGDPRADDSELEQLSIDRVYDHYMDDEELDVCDRTIAEIAESLPKRPYSSREFIREMGSYLAKHGKNPESVVQACYEKDVPIFVPAFSDCSAGFGLVHHQWYAKGEKLSIDSVKDFLELTKLKIAAKETGILMVGGGVPKNFAQDATVSAKFVGHNRPMHRYAIQLTVADERDGALSGSTLQEAHSWGKVDLRNEQMVFGEATVTFPLVAGYAYHSGDWKKRGEKRFGRVIDEMDPK